DKLRQKVRADGKDGTHRQGAAQLVFTGIGDIFDRGRLLENTMGLSHNLLTQRGRLDAGLGALKQRHTQLIFQFLNRDTQRGLTDMAALCRTAKVLFLSEGNDITQLCEGHRSDSRRMIITVRGSEVAGLPTKNAADSSIVR